MPKSVKYALIPFVEYEKMLEFKKINALRPPEMPSPHPILEKVRSVLNNKKITENVALNDILRTISAHLETQKNKISAQNKNIEKTEHVHSPVEENDAIWDKDLENDKSAQNIPETEVLSNASIPTADEIINKKENEQIIPVNTPHVETKEVNANHSLPKTEPQIRIKSSETEHESKKNSPQHDNSDLKKKLTPISQNERPKRVRKEIKDIKKDWLFYS